jgi:hypothetical protein
MFSMNKDTLVTFAVVLALITCFYLFNENKKTKADIASFKSLVNKPQIVTTQQAAKPKSRKPEPAPVPEPEPESEE